MLFNSWGYILFLVIAVLCHWILPHKYRLFILSAFSILFYSMWRWEFSLLMIFSACVDYVASGQIYKTENRTTRISWLLVSLTVNLGLLVIFKYTYFIYDNIRFIGSASGQELPDLGIRIILPLGISFYTFQTISYTIDVYRRVIKPVNSFIVFLTYVTFWPQLIAGPILRAKEVISQLTSDRKFDINNMSAGIERIIIGLFKKIAFADNIAPLVDNAFAFDPSLLNAFDVWVATFLFGFQIYFDFSAYSDIAIGSARILGIHFPENFDWPYLALSPKDFWKRWHISLSSWVRDYLYLPLAGKPFMTESTGGITVAAETDSKGKRTNALFFTWLIMGLWHGAGWTFALWGVYHALLIFIYREIKAADWLIEKLPGAAWALMLMLGMAAWIPFRSESLSQAAIMFSKILNPLQYTFSTRALFVTSYYLGVMTVLSAMLSTYFIVKYINHQSEILKNALVYAKIATIGFMVFFILLYMRPVRQFIYFQF